MITYHFLLLARNSILLFKGGFMSFPDKLRNLIEENNLTQKQLAKEFNVSASTFGGYVQGTSEPSFTMLKDIARYFHVSTDYLLSLPIEGTQDGKEEELLRIFRVMPREYRDIYLKQGKAFVRVKKS